jgi:hypothetical protein
MRLRVVLLEIVPPVWRRLEVPAHWTLRQLHVALRRAMGWSDGGPHRFRVGTALYGNTSDNASEHDSRWITLADVAAQGTRSFRYEVVSDESWLHEIVIESMAPGSIKGARAVCLGGERAWPPESTDGPDAWLERADFFVAEAPAGADFDLDAVNRALAQLG